MEKDENEIACARCGDTEHGGYSLPDGTFVCEDCLTEAEKIELGTYWNYLSDDK